MRTYTITRQQMINASLDEVWRYFSCPANLEQLTPAHMRLRVTSGKLPDELYAGLIIAYRVSPMLRIPLHWLTEITQVARHKMFTDEQRRGPFRMWRHEHHFSQTSDNRVVMRDTVSYQLPLGFVGILAHKLFIRKQLAGIFDYRRERVAALFP
jgi:ligand-binding SRPBCC domain-containing protein